MERWFEVEGAHGAPRLGLADQIEELLVERGTAALGNESCIAARFEDRLPGRLRKQVAWGNRVPFTPTRPDRGPQDRVILARNGGEIGSAFFEDGAERIEGGRSHGDGGLRSLWARNEAASNLLGVFADILV